MKIVCIGGGAASFFFAANIRKPGAEVLILEQGRQVLGKVRVSGGGRCNVTHHCFEPAILAQAYPRGGGLLIEPFTQFGPAETIQWFHERGVRVKAEPDGRMFPVTDTSETIINCLNAACRKGNVQVRTSAKVNQVTVLPGGGFEVFLASGESLNADVLFAGSGSNQHIWQILRGLGHTIVPPVPSLFTFRIKDARIAGLAGITVPNCRIVVPDTSLSSEGPVLITHQGLSGPAVLRLSAFGARIFHERQYRFEIRIDFNPALTVDRLRQVRETEGKKLLGNHQVLGLPRRLAQRLVELSEVDPGRKYGAVSNADLDVLYGTVCRARFAVEGQNTFKEEFVTAGGVDLSQIDLRTFSSTRIPGLFLAGEVLNIDGITGGFNFQAAWTGAYLAARGWGVES